MRIINTEFHSRVKPNTNIFLPSSYLVSKSKQPPISDRFWTFTALNSIRMWLAKLNNSSTHIPGIQLTSGNQKPIFIKGLISHSTKAENERKTHPVLTLSHKLLYLSPQEAEGEGFIIFSRIGRMQMLLFSWIFMMAHRDLVWINSLF